jgi:dTDP-4-amino-4,6-dideoxygalactose transaminase
MKRQILFNNLLKQYNHLKNEIDGAISNVISTSSFIRGEHVEQFEVEYATATASKHCISCGNGTDSLYISMKALGIRDGDEVIVPAHSWISSSESITQAGGRVVFCDTEMDTCLIDVGQIESHITRRTVGIIPVHLFGQACDMDAIANIAKKHNLWILEDCAQAHLAKYKDKFVGRFGHVASYSFYPGKNLGAMGDAGALTTDDDGLARRMAMYARHGGIIKGDHQIEGINSRLDGIQAAILRVKLPYLDQWNRKRRELASLYSAKLKDVAQIQTPVVKPWNEHVWHLYVIKTEKRDELAAYLKRCGIQTAVNYPTSLPYVPAYKRLGHRTGDFPNAYQNQSQILSLPIYPELETQELDYVCTQISDFYKSNKA